MSSDTELMRHWTTFNVLPSLCNLASKYAKDVTSPLYIDLYATLHNVSALTPSAIDALSICNVPNIHIIRSGIAFSGRQALINIANEAKDLSFGSTLKEQIAFTDHLDKWLLGSSSSLSKHSHGQAVMPNATYDVFTIGDDSFEHITAILSCMIQWLPKLCVPLEIHGGNVSGRERSLSSAFTAAKQIEMIGKILKMIYFVNVQRSELFFGADDNETLSRENDIILLFCSCLWKSTAEELSLSRYESSSNAEALGLLPLLQNLISLGSFVDAALLVRLQMQIVDQLCDLLMIADESLARKSVQSVDHDLLDGSKSGGNKLISALCDLGVIRSIVSFFSVSADRFILLGPFI
jgi:hypothetical protein